MSCTGTKLREFSRSIPNGTCVLITNRSVFLLVRYDVDKDGNFTLHEFQEVTAVRIP